MLDQTDLSIPSLESPRPWEDVTSMFHFLILGTRSVAVSFEGAIEWQNGEYSS
ncbi:hypothetical protein IQ235_18320 [Oscillatoriales cyanobacterium LEGE 11467]|uniref:Uncharacterized protein n=1 Tax=Zarconia navalis LEGE 11467 TaxID=1828826 RepID=A0A928VZZ2_9CYAN|nr:hypothetical protein [Zarconia navalis LEGE 11467]